MFLISKEFHFSASHTLNGLDKYHPCSRMHGHNYVVIVELLAPALNDNGFVKDYRELEPIKKWIDENLDHRHLNDIMNDSGNPMFYPNPTAEVMAFELAFIFKALMPDLSIYSVKVKETDKTMACYIL